MNINKNGKSICFVFIFLHS